MRDNQKMMQSEPGLGESAGEWLADQGVILIGSDNWGLDPYPYESPGEVNPLHLLLLVNRGIRILENLYLEEMERDKVNSFTFICLPLLIRGATASPVTPIAVV